MNEWTFWIPIHGKGDSAKEAWDDAIEKTVDAILRSAEWKEPPEALFASDDHIPPEILGGSLSDGFGVDHGPEEPPPLEFDDEEK